MMTLRGRRLVLRTATEDDVPRLRAILAEPEVARHLGAFEGEELLGKNPDSAEVVLAHVIEVGGEIVGWIGGWEKIDPEFKHAGIDLFLTTTLQGKGYGPEAIRLLCRYFFDERGHHRIVIDPSADNEHAIKAYEKVGFRRVGVMRQYERSADGTYHDGVLMDLLADDLPVEH